MQRAGIAVQLRREGETHAAPGSQVRELLLGQSLDSALLQAGIAVRLLRRSLVDRDEEPEKGKGELEHGEPHPEWLIVSPVDDPRTLHAADRVCKMLP